MQISLTLTELTVPDKSASFEAFSEKIHALHCCKFWGEISKFACEGATSATQKPPGQAANLLFDLWCRHDLSRRLPR